MEISLNILISSFNEAYARTRDANNETDPEKLFHCLFETQNWIVAIDDRLKRDRHSDSWFEQYTVGADRANFIRATQPYVIPLPLFTLFLSLIFGRLKSDV